jgi:rod shape determining protein RodA
LTQFDSQLLALTTILALIGLAGIYSATLHGANPSFFSRQFAWLAIGAVAFPFFALSDYRWLTEKAHLLYWVTNIILVAVLLFGKEISGSRSWVGIGGFGGQPSEFAKIAVILALTRQLADFGDQKLDLRHIMPLALTTLVPFVLVVLQGDLGTAITYLPILFGIIAVIGFRLRCLFVFTAIAILGAPVAWFALKDYQQQRILATLDTSMDPQGIGYQASQSLIAIGSSGLHGKGLGQGLQSQLGFVPEIHSDLIYSLLTEEWGLIGGTVILSLYLMLVLRILWVGEKAPDRVGMMLVSGVASLLAFHVVINIGMALGLVPLIGIPLPLLSYGGSSTITFLIALALVISVYRRRFLYPQI